MSTIHTEQILSALKQQYDELIQQTNGLDLTWREHENVLKLLVDTHSTVAEHCLTLYKGTTDKRFIEHIILNFERILGLVPEEVNELAPMMHIRLAFAYILIEHRDRAISHLVSAIKCISKKEEPNPQILHDGRWWFERGKTLDGFEDAVLKLYLDFLDLGISNKEGIIIQKLLVSHYTLAGEKCAQLYKKTKEVKYLKELIVNYNQALEVAPEDENGLLQELYVRLGLANQILGNFEKALPQFLKALEPIAAETKPNLQVFYDGRRWFDSDYSVHGFSGVVEDIYRYALTQKDNKELRDTAEDILEITASILDNIQEDLPNERVTSLILESKFETVERVIRGKMGYGLSANIERFNQLSELAKPVLDSIVTANGVESQRKQRRHIHGR